MAVRGLGILVASGCRGMVGEVMHPAVVADGGQDGEVAGTHRSGGDGCQFGQDGGGNVVVGVVSAGHVGGRWTGRGSRGHGGVELWLALGFWMQGKLAAVWVVKKTSPFYQFPSVCFDTSWTVKN